ncbi:hypothetical protein LX36DRAFT_652900 [Colletotrichum falcatum]|nr:hypothetical protein LX36DRAFT_652900 [Colletotrichum falcatum]
MNLLRWHLSLSFREPRYEIMNEENDSDVGSEDQLLAEKGSRPPRPRAAGFFHGLGGPFLWLHILFLTFYSALFFTLVLAGQGREQKCADDQTMVWSPAREALEPEKVLFGNEIQDDNVFRGHPRPELDAAWDTLIQYSNVKVKAEDLRRINRTSVRLRDAAGELTEYYWSGLNVHHQLHCLKMVRQAVFPEYYFKGKKPPRHLEGHIDHCIDNIRMTLMCKADISLGSYDWVDNNRRPLTNFHTEHSCYNWDLVNNWARDHSFDMYDNTSLVHPFLGKSYPLDADGKYIFTEEVDPFLGNKITPPPA